MRENLRSKTTWIRVLYMILFALIYGAAEAVISVVVLIQVIGALLTGHTNARLRELGRELGTFVSQVVCFVTFGSEEKPFPFSDWPRGAGVVPAGSLEAAAGQQPPKAA